MHADGYDLSGRVAIVTGGGEGIGRATATLLSQCGASVVIAGRTEAKLQKTAQEITAATGGRCIGYITGETIQVTGGPMVGGSAD